MGDAHVYSNHVSALSTQITRRPKPFPNVPISIIFCASEIFVQHSPTAQVLINDALVDIAKVTAADITLVGYEPHGKLDMTMAV